MNYEMAWKFLEYKIYAMAIDCVASTDGTHAIETYIKLLELMESIEKEMTTAGQGDGQSAQD